MLILISADLHCSLRSPERKVLRERLLLVAILKSLVHPESYIPL